jgi:hypothetical protein
MDDPDTGANPLQNYPELTSAVLDGTTLTISYSVPSTIANSAYPLGVEFFLADAAGREGRTYLGGESYPAPGADSVALTVSDVSPGQRVVATATDAQGNTSEFSASVEITVVAAATGGESDSDSVSLALAEQQPIVTQAADWWQAGEWDTARWTWLAAVDLSGLGLGSAATDRIILDIDAAGDGRHTADDGGEVLPGFEISNWGSQIDLLTAVLDELADVPGLDDWDDANGLLAGVLQPCLADIDEVLMGEAWLA